MPQRGSPPARLTLVEARLPGLPDRSPYQPPNSVPRVLGELQRRVKRLPQVRAAAPGGVVHQRPQELALFPPALGRLDQVRRVVSAREDAALLPVVARLQAVSERRSPMSVLLGNPLARRGSRNAHSTGGRLQDARPATGTVSMASYCSGGYPPLSWKPREDVLRVSRPRRLGPGGIVQCQRLRQVHHRVLRFVRWSCEGRSVWG
jgi:hypothetical protein